jgi:hypothetical protein
MKYEFSVYKYIDYATGKEFSKPRVVTVDSEKYGWFFHDEINHLSQNIHGLERLLQKLKELVDGSIDNCSTWIYELYGLECNSSVCNIIDLFDDDKTVGEVKTIEFYQLLIDWQNFIFEYEKNSNI